MMEFLANNLRYPEELKAKGTQGRVVVQFVVNADGSISDAKVIRKVAPLMDAEALRVVNAMPRWKPGVKDGKTVAVKYTVPISFRNSEVDIRKVAENKVNISLSDNAKDVTIVVTDGETESYATLETLKELNPSNIESVSILKGEEAIKMYGEKGQKGVMVIRTKGAAYDAEGNLKVQGLVTDEQGEPVIGATVVISGSKTGVVSDADGKFTLSAPKGTMLEVRYVGYSLVKVMAEPAVHVKLKKE